MRLLGYSLVRNMLALLVSRGVYGAFLLVSSVLVARHSGVEALAVYGLAVVFGTYASIIADFGVTPYLVPTLARIPRREWSSVWADVLRFQGVSAPSLALAFAAFAGLVYGGQMRWAVLATIPWWILTRFAGAARSVFTVAEQLHYDAIATCVEVAVGLTAVRLLLAVGAAPALLLLALGGGALVALPVRLLGLRRVGVRRAKPIRSARELARATLAFNGFSVLVALYMRVDVVLLSLLAAPVALGLYQAPVRLVSAALLIPEALVPILLGRAARAPGDRTLRERHELLLGIAIAVAALGVLAVALVGGDVLAALYGAQFRAAGLAFALLAAAVPVRLLSYLNGNELTARGHQSLRLGCMALTAAFAVAAGAPAIAAYGFEGAAAVTLASEAVLATAYALASWRAIGRDAVLRPRARLRATA